MFIMYNSTEASRNQGVSADTYSLIDIYITTYMYRYILYYVSCHNACSI